MPSGKPLSFQQRAYIRTFYNTKTVGQIAQELGVSRKAVSTHIREREEKYI